MDALAGEIERLRLSREESGELSRSNERRLKACKERLEQLLGAAVVYPEDRQHVPRKAHVQVVFGMKKIASYLKEFSGTVHDGQLYRLMHDIFDFEVTRETIDRYYYMSDKERDLSK